MLWWTSAAFVLMYEAEKKRWESPVAVLLWEPLNPPVLHVQIPQQTGLECQPGLSCSKELWGQTCQVNLSQSDRVYPQTCPLLSKNTWGPGSTVIPPYTAALWWFTAHVHTPYKHIIHMSSSRLAEGLSWSCWPDFKDLSTAPLLTSWNITQGQLVVCFPQEHLHLCHIIALILVYLGAHSLSGVNVYLKSHKGKFTCHPFNIFMPGSCGANSQERQRKACHMLAEKTHPEFKHN